MNSAKNKAKSKAALKVFVSFASADKAYARKLLNSLSLRPNLRIFTTNMLSAGEDWESKLKSELSATDLFFILLSRNSLESRWVLHEFGAAWGLQKPIIPILTDPEAKLKVPVELRNVHLVNISDLENPDILNQILARYETLAAA